MHLRPLRAYQVVIERIPHQDMLEFEIARLRISLHEVERLQEFQSVFDVAISAFDLREKTGIEPTPDHRRRLQ